MIDEQALQTVFDNNPQWDAGMRCQFWSRIREYEAAKQQPAADAHSNEQPDECRETFENMIVERDDYKRAVANYPGVPLLDWIMVGWDSAKAHLEGKAPARQDVNREMLEALRWYAEPENMKIRIGYIGKFPSQSEQHLRTFDVTMLAKKAIKAAEQQLAGETPKDIKRGAEIRQHIEVMDKGTSNPGKLLALRCLLPLVDGLHDEPEQPVELVRELLEAAAGVLADELYYTGAIEEPLSNSDAASVARLKAALSTVQQWLAQQGGERHGE